MAFQDQVPVELFGLPHWDEMLLRSVFKLVKGKTRKDWQLDEKSPPFAKIVSYKSAALVADAPLAGAGRQPILIYYVDGALPTSTTHPFVLQAPVKPQALIALLNRVGELLDQVPAPSRRVSWSLLQWLDSLLLRSSTIVQRISVDDVDIAYIDFVKRCWLPKDDGAAWISAAAGHSMLLARPAAAEQLNTCDWNQARPLNELIWRLAQLASHGQLLARLNRDRLFTLNRWPDFTQQSDWRDFINTASGLSQRPMTYAEIVATAKGTEDQLIIWLNAGALSGCLAQVGAVQISTQDAALSTEDSGRFMSRLRSKLGFK
jgi:hypothetical protein